MDRRRFVTSTLAAGTGIGLTGTQTLGEARKSKVLILGVSCSPRKGKTTATSIQVALDAAKTVSPRIEVDLLDLAGFEVSGWKGGATPSEAMTLKDDFDLLLPKFQDPSLGGLIIGSPSYFRSMSSLCKAFLERLAVLRNPKLFLADKPVGALSVGAFRNGGQELVIEQILTAMLCHEVLVVGGKPRAHQGATLWNAFQDDIMKDTFGIDTARKLGIRVAEAALHQASG
ncbi:MAG: flavodoxin family protein [Sedimentisphaerales bacterium]|nr:flavodoxin family protein [Sedimentisphaerales bacterium]